MRKIKNKILILAVVISIITPLSVINISSQENNLSNDEIFELLVRQTLDIDDDEVLTGSDYASVTELSTSFHDDPYNWDDGKHSESKQLTDLSLLAKLPNLKYLIFNPLKDNPILPANTKVLNTLSIKYIELGDRDGYGSQVDVTDEQRIALTKVYREFLNSLNGERLDTVTIKDDQISDYQWLLGLDMSEKVEYIYNSYTELSNNPKIKLDYEFSHYDKQGNKIYKMHFKSPLPTVLGLSNQSIIVEDHTYKNVQIETRTYLNTIENSDNPIFYDIDGNTVDKFMKGHYAVDLFFPETLLEELKEEVKREVEYIKNDIEYYHEDIEFLKNELISESNPEIIEQIEREIENIYEYINELETLLKEYETEGISNVILYYVSMNQEIDDESSNSFIFLHNDYEIVLGREIPEYYNVSFQSNGGTLVEDINGVEENTKIHAPNAPTKKGYQFSGWFKESTLENEWNFDADIVLEDTILYAKWQEDTHTVTFDSKGGSKVSALESIKHNSIIDKPEDPKKTGYAFMGWKTEGEFWKFDTDRVTEDIILTAEWRKNSVIPEVKDPDKNAPEINNFKEENKIVNTGLYNSTYGFILLLISALFILIVQIKHKYKEKK